MNTSHSLVQGSNAPWRRMGCVQLGQNSFVCSKHFSQFGICKMLDALLHSSWCELCALLAEGSQLSIWISLSLETMQCWPGDCSVSANRWECEHFLRHSCWLWLVRSHIAIWTHTIRIWEQKNGHHSCSVSSNWVCDHFLRHSCWPPPAAAAAAKVVINLDSGLRISVFRFQRHKLLIQYSLTGMTDTVNSRGLFIIGSMYLPQADDCRWEKICCLDAKMAQTQRGGIFAAATDFLDISFALRSPDHHQHSSWKETFLVARKGLHLPNFLPLPRYLYLRLAASRHPTLIRKKNPSVPNDLKGATDRLNISFLCRVASRLPSRSYPDEQTRAVEA